ncbi:MAG: CPBP family intramembrane glutamic endopeptidase [Promethearchaeota archaeon]
MVNLKEVIKHYPLFTFFILTFSFSWIIFFIYVLNPNEISLMFVILAIYAPALMALLISKITGDEQNNNNALVKWIVFFIIWIIATITFILNYLIQTMDFSLIILIAAFILGLLPAIMVSSGFSKNSDIKTIFQSYVKPKGHFGFYLFAILYLPTIFFIGIAITLAIGETVIWLSLPSGFELVGLIILTFLYTFFFGAGTNEEPGWRGFALPKLQLKYSPLVASLILGLIWGFWHAPIYLPQYDYPFEFILFLLNTLKITIILTWLYNRTRGNVLSTALLHTIGNLTFEFIPATLASEIIQIIIPIILIFIDRMWKKN